MCGCWYAQYQTANPQRIRLLDFKVQYIYVYNLFCKKSMCTTAAWHNKNVWVWCVLNIYLYAYRWLQNFHYFRFCKYNDSLLGSSLRQIRKKKPINKKNLGKIKQHTPTHTHSHNKYNYVFFFIWNENSKDFLTTKGCKKGKNK